MQQSKFSPRAYAPDDLSRVLRFVGECNARADFCGYLHPGDVLHFLSNGLRGRDAEKHIYLWEDGQRQLLALSFLYPARHSGYNLMVHPDQRGSDLERAAIDWSEQAEWALMQEAGSESEYVGSDVMDCDSVRAELLRSAGYEPVEEPYMVCTTRSLQLPIPASVLPEGFIIRAVAGEQDVEQLCAVHSGSFGSKWQPEEYLRVMRSPGFHTDRELVVVAPDGRFAAFLIYWIDPVSQSGLFEPVGCHRDFQRRGLTKALMFEGMRRMVDHGMRTAIVNHMAGNEAATALYRSAGFERKYDISDFRKKMK